MRAESKADKSFGSIKAPPFKAQPSPSSAIPEHSEVPKVPESQPYSPRESSSCFSAKLLRMRAWLPPSTLRS